MQPSTFVDSARRMLTEVILPFWMTRMVDARGGFYGRIDGCGNVYPEAVKGAVLNARILWTFAAAYRVMGDSAYLATATRAKRTLIDTFIDPQFGGVFWSVNPDGTPCDTKKQIYALGFAIYGLSEYVRATGDEEALTHAVRLFDAIETHSRDHGQNGYFEAFARDWSPLDDVRLSDKDANERKTMNTHLHILEPYTNLYRVWPDARLAEAIRNLIGIFTGHILDPQTHHLRLFFHDDWTPTDGRTSYGHDIEASWLLHEAALVLGDPDILRHVEPAVRSIASHAEFDALRIAAQWWEYAETVVGYLNIWQHWGDEEAYRRAVETWDFIGHYLVDPTGGEWYWSVHLPDYAPNLTDDKAGFWKCPYHNSRACLEIIERLH